MEGLKQNYIIIAKNINKKTKDEKNETLVKFILP